jgi:hypothetical protein
MAYVGTPIDTTNQFQSLVGKRFSGNASTTAFTLDVAPSSTLDIEVFVENVRQDPNSAYSLSGTTLTFAAAPPSGTNNIYVVHQAKAVGTISPAAGTVNADSFDNTVISGHTALAATPADTDEFLISDAGTIKRIDYSYIKASNTPAFHAFKSGNTNISSGSDVKIGFDTELFDSDSKYDNSTNYRFTPGVAGKYLVYGQVNASNSSGEEYQYGAILLYKNGSELSRNAIDFNNNSAGKGNQIIQAISMIVDFDTDDYVEMYVKASVGSGTPSIAGDSSASPTFFGAYKIIGA